MKKQLACLLALLVMFSVTGCRSPRLLGWRGSRCNPSPSLLRRAAPPAFQPPTCDPGCGVPTTSYDPASYGAPPIEQGWTTQEGNLGTILPPTTDVPIEQRGYFPAATKGAVVAGPETGGIPLPPS